MLQRNSQRGANEQATEQSKSQQLRFLITQEDLDRISLCKETVAKAKDFRTRAQQININVPLVSQEELKAGLNDEKVQISDENAENIVVTEVQQPDQMDHFLSAIHEIIHADLVNKRPVEIAQIEMITRVISSSQKGEQCRDVLRYISNLRKQFNECLGQLDILTTQASAKYSKTREVQIQQNNALSTELVRVQKLSSALKNRDADNAQLKQQLETLLQALKQRDVQQKSDAESKSERALSQQQFIEDKREQDIISLSQRLEQELSSNKALSLMDRLKNELSTFMQENMQLKIQNQQTEMRFEAQSRNLVYLEDKLAAALTEREEQVVELKSQIVIYQQKARSYKQKLKFELEEFKRQNMQNDQDNCFKEKQMVELELSKVQALVIERESEIQEYEAQAERYRRRIEEIQKQFSEQLEAREIKYQTLKDQLQTQERDHQIKLKSQVDKVQTERRAMDRFEQEQTVKELRLEYLESNQKKMQQQKDFLEKQIAKDIRDMQQQMLKTKLEIKKDQLISSQSALQRLEQMYSMMQQSLHHVTRVVSFMTFDVDSQAINITEQSESEINKDQNIQDTVQKANTNLTEKSSGQNLFNDGNNQGVISTEQLLQKYPLELMETMAQWLHEMWQNTNSPPADDLEQMLSQLKLRTSATKVDEISRNFLLSNRLHFDQYLFRLKEKNQALQSERDRLQKKLQEMHEEMEDILQEYGNESVNQEVVKQLESDNQNTISDRSPLYQQDLVPPDTSTIKKTFKQRGASLNQNFHLKVSVTKRLNDALTERVRDIKLILNRKYFELEDQMRLQKDKYEIEISQMRVQYGKDLNQVHADCKKALNLQRKEMDEAHKIDFQRLKGQMSDQFKKLKSDFEEALKKLNKEKMQERYQKQQYFQELKKQKQESCGLYAGGFGTFTIAFENPVHTKLVKCQQQLVEHQQDLEILKSTLQGAKAKLKQSMLQQHADKEKLLQEEWRQLQLKLEQIEIIPLDKLNHFIEVGFQLSARNYQSLMTYNDQAYESMAKKYVFEFQDALDYSKEEQEYEEMSLEDKGLALDHNKLQEQRLLQKENLLRQQISDNFALFNEINPIYISLNLGRPVTTFPDVSLPIENFRLAHRISSNVSGQYLTINFLKADLPFTMLRIIAFNNQTCQSYELDLTKEDILIFVESNLKFLEEENSTDLYHLLANSLTIIQRKTQSRQGSYSSPVLTVEHRCFFNELYRNNWDARNKKIKARHNKFQQGLIKEIACITEFDQSILYEGFQDVFETEICLNLGNNMADHFSVLLQQGMHSGHLKLNLKLLYSKDVEQTLFLMRQPEDSQESRTQNLAAAFIQKPDMQEKNQALAYIVSMEKIFGATNEEHVLVKISSLQKLNSDQMLSFKWSGEGPPNLSSTKTVSEIIFLTKKCGVPSKFCQVKDFDVLNTEVRAQLFSHAFGYQQVKADFGDVSTQEYDLTEQKEIFIGNMESMDEMEASRVIQNSQIDIQESIIQAQMHHRVKQDLKNQQKTSFVLPPPVIIDQQHKQFIHHQFTIIRVKTIDENNDEYIESHYAHINIHSSQRLIELNQLDFEIQLPELDIHLQQDISPMQVLQQNQFNNLISLVDIEKNSKLILDQLIINVVNDVAIAEINIKIEPFSQLLLQMKQSKFDETMAKIGLVQFQLEFPDAKALQVSKSDLVDCKKTHTITVIGQRSFKLTCYFLPLLRNRKVKQKDKFDFDCIYVEAFSIALDKTFEFALTEHDIGTLVEMLKEATQHKTSIEYQINCEKLMSSTQTHQQLMTFVIELIQFDPITPRIYPSFEQLLEKMTERRKLEIDFMESGGRFIKADPIIKSNEQQAHSELNRTLITSIEKDLSNSKIYIKVYRCSLVSLPGKSKLQIEIFDIEEPQILFKIDYLTSQDGVGKQVLLERFSLTDEAFLQHNQDQNLEYNENGQNRGLIFSISETSFPHEINLMLLEPCSHIFWYTTVKDDKINMIERRSDRQVFAIHLERSLANEILRDIPRLGFREVNSGYQKRQQDIDTGMQIEVMKSELKQLAAQKIGDLQLVYGRTLEFPTLNGFVEIRLMFNNDSRKLVLEWTEKSQDDKILVQLSWQMQIISQAESSRFYQGSVRSANGFRLICQIEQAAAAHAKDSCLRISFHKIISQNQLETIFDLAIVDPQLLKPDCSVREDVKFELGVGYKDTFASIFKMDDISNDIAISKVQLPTQPPMIEPRKDPWALIYRRVYKQNENSYIISAMQHENLKMLKLNVFESISMQQQVFVFNISDVFTNQEIEEFQDKPDLFKQQIKMAVNSRLRIRELTLDKTEKQQRLQNKTTPSSSLNQCTFSASFLNPSVIQNQTSNQIALNQIFPEIDEFDIRNECTNKIFLPTNLLEIKSEEPKPKKYTLLAQYSRDDYLFDVYQVLNPFELMLKVQVYHANTFQLIASASCSEVDLRRELANDQMSHLMEGTQREQLAQYLIANSQLDENRQLMIFQRTEYVKVKFPS